MMRFSLALQRVEISLNRIPDAKNLGENGTPFRLPPHGLSPTKAPRSFRGRANSVAPPGMAAQSTIARPNGKHLIPYR